MTAAPTTPAEIAAHFAGWADAGPAVLDDEARAYLAYHRRRYAALLAAVGDAARNTGTPPGDLRILDVGPNFQTELLRRAEEPATVDTLGFAHPAFPPREGERHVEFDLNDAQHRDRWPAPGGHDVVVMAEVIEHLYTSPVTVLACVASWLRGRGRIVIQTPNACALHKRVRMALGRNPYEPIRASRENPGHFHEYTLAELGDAAREAGLRPERATLQNYFEPGTRGARLYNSLGPVLPRTLRHGITICLAPATEEMAA